MDQLGELQRESDPESSFTGEGSFQLELAIEEDIPTEVDDFVRFSRLGFFKEADEVLDEALKDHLDLFPVVAEYADALLEQRRYRELSDFLEQVRDEKFEAAEIQLLELLKCLSDIYYKGWLIPALGKARSWRSSFVKSSGEVSAIDVSLAVISYE
jgi:hypothetical protein